MSTTHRRKQEENRPAPDCPSPKVGNKESTQNGQVGTGEDGTVRKEVLEYAQDSMKRNKRLGELLAR